MTVGWVLTKKSCRRFHSGENVHARDNPLKLPSPTKLVRLGHFPSAGQAGRLACPVFYTISFLWIYYSMSVTYPCTLWPLRAGSGAWTRWRWWRRRSTTTWWPATTRTTGAVTPPTPPPTRHSRSVFVSQRDCSKGTVSRVLSPFDEQTAYSGIVSFALHCYQGISKRCRLSLLTNSALLQYTSPRVGRGGGSCGVSASKCCCTQEPK